jgi:hypothetical protein
MFKAVLLFEITVPKAMVAARPGQRYRSNHPTKAERKQTGTDRRIQKERRMRIERQEIGGFPTERSALNRINGDKLKSLLPHEKYFLSC